MVTQPGTSNSRDPKPPENLLDNWKKQCFQTKRELSQVRGTQSQSQSQRAQGRNILNSFSSYQLTSCCDYSSQTLPEPEDCCLWGSEPPLSQAQDTDQVKDKKKLMVGFANVSPTKIWKENSLPIENKRRKPESQSSVHGESISCD